MDSRADLVSVLKDFENAESMGGVESKSFQWWYTSGQISNMPDLTLKVLTKDHIVPTNVCHLIANMRWNYLTRCIYLISVMSKFESRDSSTVDVVQCFLQPVDLNGFYSTGNLSRHAQFESRYSAKSSAKLHALLGKFVKLVIPGILMLRMWGSNDFLGFHCYYQSVKMSIFPNCLIWSDGLHQVLKLFWLLSLHLRRVLLPVEWRSACTRYPYVRTKSTHWRTANFWATQFWRTSWAQ